MVKSGSFYVTYNLHNMKKLIAVCILSILCSISAEAHPGIGIVMDSKDNVYYTDLTHVWKISPNGIRSIAVKNVHTHELYLDDQDDLYGEHEWYEGEATDKWGNYVWCLSKDGVLEKTVQDIEGLLDNNTLVRNVEGTTYWAERSGEIQQLHKQTSTGTNTLLTEHNFKDIRWLYFSKTDNALYVVDHLKIKKVTTLGKVLVIADNLKEAGPPFEGVADRHYIFGIWTDKNNDLYLALYGASKVKKISANGKITTVFESQKGWSPCGGMMTTNGVLWIMEFSDKNTTRVRKVDPNGKNTVYGG